MGCKAIRTAECKEHKYKPEIEQRAPIWDTGISHCLDCVWAWNNWLERMLERHGGHTAECASWGWYGSWLKPWLSKVYKTCDCGWAEIEEGM